MISFSLLVYCGSTRFAFLFDRGAATAHTNFAWSVAWYVGRSVAWVPPVVTVVMFLTYADLVIVTIH